MADLCVSFSCDMSAVRPMLDELLALAERSERAREVIEHALSSVEGRTQAFWFDAEPDSTPRAGDVLLRFQAGEGLRDLVAAARAAESPGSPLPSSYVSASWHCVLPVDADGRQGIGFNLADGRVVRLAIDAETALALVTEICAYRVGDPRFHSPISDGSPSRDGSPQDGQNV